MKKDPHGCIAANGASFHTWAFMMPSVLDVGRGDVLAKWTIVTVSNLLHLAYLND